MFLYRLNLSFTEIIHKSSKICIKFIAVFLAATMILSGFFTNTSVKVYAEDKQVWPSSPDIFAECGVLIEASTGTVLYDKGCHNKMYPASITKIMTTLLALENGNLADMVEFYHYDIYSLELGAAHIARQEGELLSLKDTLHAVMLASANECANATGEYVARKSDAYANRIAELSAGDTEYSESKVALEVFADMMNSRAKEAGALGTHFTNPSGLFDENHYTTAYDMAMIMRDAIKNDDFLKIESNITYTIPTTNKATEPQAIANRHKMMFPLNAEYYEGILGGKTGYVDQSGTTLVTSAKRNGMTLISVVMRSNGSNVYNDTRLLLDYGFNNFSLSNVAENETKFSSNSSSDFSNLNTVFGSNNSVIELSPDGYVVIPNGVSLKDCHSELAFIDSTDQVGSSIANIRYTYAGVDIGGTSLVIKQNTDTYEFGPSKENETKKETPSKNDNFIKINIWIILLVVILLISAVLIIRYTKTIQNINRSRRRRKRLRKRKKIRSRKKY